MSVYKSSQMNPKTYLRATALMKNEIRILGKIARIIAHHVKTRKTAAPIRILYLCCGPAPILYHLLVNSNYRVFGKTKQSIQKLFLQHTHWTGIDINSQAINFNKRYYSFWNFTKDDAITFNAHETFDIVLINSGYHHIPDSQKQAFMKNIQRHLIVGGVLICGENVFTQYKTEKERPRAVHKYYQQLTNFYKTKPAALKMIKGVYSLDMNREEEYKTDLSRLITYAYRADLKPKEVYRLWPKRQKIRISNLDSPTLFGSFVITFVPIKSKTAS